MSTYGSHHSISIRVTESFSNNDTYSSSHIYSIYTDVDRKVSLPEDMFPFVGGLGDKFWLECNIDNLNLYNGVDYKWYLNIKFQSYETIFKGYIPYDDDNNSLIYLPYDENIRYLLNYNIDNKKNCTIIINSSEEAIITGVSSTTLNDIKYMIIRTDLSFSVSVGDWFEIYTETTELTTPEYYFKARTTPEIVFNVSEIISNGAHTFEAIYSQKQKTGVAYFQYDLYTDGELVNSSGQVFSQNISHTFESLVNGKKYTIKLLVVNDDGIELEAEREFTAEYELSASVIKPIISVDNFKACINVDFSNNELTNDIMGYKIQRYEVDYDRLFEVATLGSNELYFEDYNIRNNKSYQYRITPIYFKDDKELLGMPITTDEIYTDWCGWSVIGTKPTEDSGKYIVDYENIWTFELNTESEAIRPVFNKTYITGFGQYPKVIQGQENYLEGGLKCLIGNILNEEYTNDSIDTIEKWREFCNNGELKLLKDRKGHVIPCSIKDTTPTFMGDTLEQVTVISFNFVQLMDKHDISVYGLGV